MEKQYEFTRIDLRVFWKCVHSTKAVWHNVSEDLMLELFPWLLFDSADSGSVLLKGGLRWSHINKWLQASVTGSQDWTFGS